MRNYRKKDKSYTPQQLEEAIQDVLNKSRSLRRAAKDLGVTHDTLRKKLAAASSSLPSTDQRGKKTVFSTEVETILADHLKTLTKWGFGLTRPEVLIIVRDYCVKNNIPNPFKNNTPGQEWFENFCIRSKLKLKSTERLEKARQKNTSNPFLVYEFYDIIEDLGEELGIVNKPEHFWNLDECGVEHDPKRCKAVAGKDQKNLTRTDQGPGRENTTVMGCISADGRRLPPMFIFKAAKLWSTWKGSKDIPGTFYSVSKSGFITSEIFREYFLKFCRSVKERPLMLIVDGHITHLDFESVQLARAENVAIVKLPSHCTDLLQPLDRSCFGPFKQRWTKALLEWQRLNQRPLSKSEFVDLVCDNWESGLSSLNIIAGFRASGIQPINRDKYPVSRFNPTKLAQYLDMKASKKSEVNQPTSMANEALMLEIPAAQDLVHLNLNELDCSEVIVLDDNVTLDTSKIDEINLEESFQVPDETDNYELFSEDSLSEASTVVLPTTSCQEANPAPTSPSPTLNCTFEELLLRKVNSTPAPTGPRRMIPSNATVITSDEFTETLKQIQENQKKNKKKNARNVAAKPNTSQTSDQSSTTSKPAKRNRGKKSKQATPLISVPMENGQENVQSTSDIALPKPHSSRFNELGVDAVNPAGHATGNATLSGKENSMPVTPEVVQVNQQAIFSGEQPSASNKRKRVKSKVRSNKKSHNEPSSESVEVEENNEPVGEGNFIQVKIGGFHKFCRIDKVLDNLEEALVTVCEQIEGQAYRLSETVLIQFTDVVKKVHDPAVDSEGLYKFL